MEILGSPFWFMVNGIQIESSWGDILHEEWTKPYFIQLTSFLKQEYATQQILPKEESIFEAFNQCPFEKVKVVILGQDPYPTPGHAHGLCFSVEPDIRPKPKSLNTIFQEIERDLQLPIPENGDLHRWAKQGVLLLNTVLTVEAHKSNAHAGKGWEFFTNEVILQLNEKRENLVFLLWGNKAQQKKRFIDTKKHCVLEASHPSPLSAYRGFIGCNHFSKTNLFLEQHQLAPINW